MDKNELRAIILEEINKQSLKSFDFEAIQQIVETAIKQEMPPQCIDMLYEVIRDLVKERVISPVPHGAPTFFVNKRRP